MSFNYDSMYTKYEVVIGKPWNSNSASLSVVGKSHLTKVTLAKHTTLQDGLRPIRDWCEDNFGDNWIYEWNDFYFKNEEDAIVFKLRWL